MALTPAEIAMLRESFSELSPELEEASVAFYQRLFAIAPELAPLFRTDIENQGMRFMSAVGTILDRLDDPEDTDGFLLRLGEGHAALGIKPEHFLPMRAALIETFRETLGDRFTAERAAAWRKAYDLIASGMLAAHRRR